MNRSIKFNVMRIKKVGWSSLTKLMSQFLWLGRVLANQAFQLVAIRNPRVFDGVLKGYAFLLVAEQPVQ